MNFADTFRGLVNKMSGLGGERDKGAQGEWAFQPLDRLQIENAYRSNWMVRKAVDIPAFDMLREGWTWKADEEVVGKIEAEEKRLNVVGRIREALKYARLFGGAALLVSDGTGDYSRPLEPRRVGKGGIQFLKVIDRYHLQSGEIETDPLAANYLEPKFYHLSGTSRGLVIIHP
ncbi:DUF1073 domain-containing protein [Pararhizobium mangrovi]|uniref:DUF1073 domain-containing protein n=1 Tax=Pararhizobium mangrovi TaxID=2590452 RepID=A0A506TVB9_9HYPH|nr:DUF1073 domain-containing protein [Pararhizobium mangrovi]